MEIRLHSHHASDLAVVNAARVSFDSESQAMDVRDEGLIGYLMRNGHGSPFEHGYFRFLVHAPIFVAREWMRHRAGHSYNEMSGRYTELERCFYCPREFRTQTGKPGAYQYEVMQGDNLWGYMSYAYDVAWESYQQLIARGVAKEQARAVLPVGIYTKFYWSCNPRSLMHFLGLRNHEHAQQEIRELADRAESDFARIMPVTWRAFVDNGRKAP